VSERNDVRHGGTRIGATQHCDSRQCRAKNQRCSICRRIGLHQYHKKQKSINLLKNTENALPDAVHLRQSFLQPIRRTSNESLCSHDHRHHRPTIVIANYKNQQSDDTHTITNKYTYSTKNSGFAPSAATTATIWSQRCDNEAATDVVVVDGDGCELCDDAGDGNAPNQSAANVRMISVRTVPSSPTRDTNRRHNVATLAAAGYTHH
jgi:hypothetical protein